MTIPLGVVLRRRPGVTRWAKWAWSVKAVVPGGEGDWRVLREDGDVTDWLVAARPLELHHTDVESYRTSLMMKTPSLFVILNKGLDAGNEHGIAVHMITASADLAQEYQDSDEVIVEPVPMPDTLIGTIRDFATEFFRDEPFKKRKRDRVRIDRHEDGKGDARIRQEADVFRAPGSMKRGQES